jgi:uncharacterized RDD family membrane protein YckC
MEYEDRARIATAEGLELDLELAGLGSRGSARALDMLLQTLILIAVWIAFGATANDELSGAALAIVGSILTFVVIWGYDSLFEAFNSGQTPGKSRLQIRVVAESGGAINFRMAAVRNLLRIIDEGTLFLVAFLTIARSKRNQRLGDMLAGTLVIRDAPEAGTDGSESELQLRESSWRVLETASGWDTTAVGSEDLAVVRQFLLRRPVLPPERRRSLASALAGRLRDRVPGSDPTIDNEQFLEILAALKARRG